jgi:hypothetical protein
MHYKALGNTGHQVSNICLGTSGEKGPGSFWASRERKCTLAPFPALVNCARFQLRSWGSGSTYLFEQHVQALVQWSTEYRL